MSLRDTKSTGIWRKFLSSFAKLKKLKSKGFAFAKLNQKINF